MASRRQFLCWTAGFGGALGLGMAPWLTHGVRPPLADDAGVLATVSRTARALGSEVSMQALHADQNIAQVALDDAFAELELVEELMSIYRPHSQLSSLNRAGVLDDPHPYFVEVLEASRDMSLRSGGAFDITVQPLWGLFASRRKSGTLPDESAIDQVRRRVDWRRVEISPRRIRLLGEGTCITLNGIAQGYAADRAMAALRKRGIERALIDSGEVGSLGRNGQGQPWTVGIQHPRVTDAFLSLTRLAGRCLATSGDYATPFSDDFRWHHIFDPHTGRSPTELASVSIAAPTAMQADALSTAVFVLGTELGSELVRSIPDADALFVWKDGRTLATDGFLQNGQIQKPEISRMALAPG
jgi:thiamine biosynthesis lipoprotein